MEGINSDQPAKERSIQFNSIFNNLKQGEISAMEAARRLGVSHTAFLTWAKEQNK
jgi:hypothetical protein